MNQNGSKLQSISDEVRTTPVDGSVQHFTFDESNHHGFITNGTAKQGTGKWTLPRMSGFLNVKKTYTISDNMPMVNKAELVLENSNDELIYARIECTVEDQDGNSYSQTKTLQTLAIDEIFTTHYDFSRDNVDLAKLIKEISFEVKTMIGSSNGFLDTKYHPS